MNIKEIAKKAGVSVATVSHVVNKTRYVSSELTDRVLSVIEESDGKPGFLLRNRKALELQVILCIVDNVTDYFYTDLMKGIRARASEEGNRVIFLNSHNKGLIHEYIRLEKPAGCILVTDRYGDDTKITMKELTIPMVTVGHAGEVAEQGDVIFNHYESAFKGTRHLIKSGHDRIRFVCHRMNLHIFRSMFAGYRDALESNGIAFDPALTSAVNPEDPFSQVDLEAVLREESRPTAWLSASGTTTMALLKFINSNNLKCPDDISLVSLHEFEWSHMLNPAVTTVAHDPLEIGMKSVDKLNDKIRRTADANANTLIPCRITVRNSTQCIGRGPHGEKAENPDVLHLSSSDMERVKSGSYTAAISFHYSGTAFARLHEKGIKDVFTELGVRVLVVTDAHFDPEMQNKQLELIQTMKPDVLISIPADEIVTAQSYKEMARSGVKLVLIDNVPHGFERGDYVTCVSVNERENGQIAGRILGEYLVNNGKRKIGLLMHGGSFFNTNQRDMAVEQVLTEEFPDLQIVTVQPFLNDAGAYEKCREVLQHHPGIEGLYVSWEGPAVAVLKALREMNREDVCIVTSDLDREVALDMAAGGPVKGLSAQRPYDQGRAVALSAAHALIGNSIPSFIGVSPYKVTSDNLLTAWQDILRERAPTELVNALKSGKPHITSGGHPASGRR